MITPDRIKAFLDDLALISARHGIIVSGYCGEWDFEAMPSGFTGYGAGINGARVLTASNPACERIETQSLDVSTLTAHQRMALERSLAGMREQER